MTNSSSTGASVKRLSHRERILDMWQSYQRTETCRATVPAFPRIDVQPRAYKHSILHNTRQRRIYVGLLCYNSMAVTNRRPTETGNGQGWSYFSAVELNKNSRNYKIFRFQTTFAPTFQRQLRAPSPVWHHERAASYRSVSQRVGGRSKPWYRRRQTRRCR